MANILESYFVSLEFKDDPVGFRKFDEVLSRAEETVERHTKGIGLSLLKVQGGILGAFTAVSGAVVGMMSHLAMADQGYRLMGLHALMSASSAEKLDRITKTLGVTLEDIVWDPTGELQGRAKVLAADIDTMKGFLGTDYKEKSRQIRDIVFQFDRLKNLLPDLGRLMMMDIFKAFGLDLGDVSTKFSDFVLNVEKNAPQIAQKITNIVVPVLKDTWEMLKLMGEAVVVFTTGVMRMIGVFSGDKQLANAPLTFDNMAEAIQHVIAGMKDLFDWITKAEIGIGHLFNAMALALARNWSGAADELKTAVSEITGMFGGVTDRVETSADRIRGAIGGMVSDQMRAHHWAEKEPGEWTLGFAKKKWADFEAGAYEWRDKLRNWGTPGTGPDKLRENIRDFGGPGSGSWELRDYLRQWISQTTGLRTPENQWVDQGQAQRMIESASTLAHVPLALSLAVAKQESQFQQLDRHTGRLLKSDKGAIGMYQLMPDTARGLHVDPTDASQNIMGGNRYLAELLQRYNGDQLKAIAAYNTGPGNVDAAVSKYGRSWLSHLAGETQDYVPKVRKYEALFAASQKSDSDAARALGMNVSGKDAEMSLATMAKTPVAAPRVAPTTYQHKTDVGGVSIHITQPGASPDQIKQAVQDGIWEHANRQIQNDLAHISANW